MINIQIDLGTRFRFKPYFSTRNFETNSSLRYKLWFHWLFFAFQLMYFSKDPRN